MLIGSERISCPDDPDLIAELDAFKAEFIPSGHLTTRSKEGRTPWSGAVLGDACRSADDDSTWGAVYYNYDSPGNYSFL